MAPLHNLPEKSAADKPPSDKLIIAADKPIADKRLPHLSSPSSPETAVSMTSGSWYTFESPQQSITSQGRAEGERQMELERALRETLVENRRLHGLADRLLRENEELRDRVKQLDLVSMLYEAAKSEIEALLAPCSSSRRTIADPDRGDVNVSNISTAVPTTKAGSQLPPGGDGE